MHLDFWDHGWKVLQIILEKIILEIKGKYNSTFVLYLLNISVLSVKENSAVSVGLAGSVLEYFLCCATLTSGSMLFSMILLHFHDAAITSHKYVLEQKLRSSFQQTLQLYFLSHINIGVSCHPSSHLLFQVLGTFSFFSLLALFNAKIPVGILARLVKKSTCEP